MSPPVLPNHLSPLEKRVLSDFAERVRAEYGLRVEAILLFGSRARAEGTTESDLDVWIGLRALERDERRNIIDQASDLSVASGLVLSPLVVDPETWKPTPGLQSELLRDRTPL